MLSIITHTQSAVSSPIGRSGCGRAVCLFKARIPWSPSCGNRSGPSCVCVCVWAYLFVRLRWPGRKVAIYTNADCALRRGHGRRPGHTAFMCRCSGTVNKHECERSYTHLHNCCVLEPVCRGLRSSGGCQRLAPIPSCARHCCEADSYLRPASVTKPFCCIEMITNRM